jgi:hypothetical protein
VTTWIAKTADPTRIGDLARRLNQQRSGQPGLSAPMVITDSPAQCLTGSPAHLAALVDLAEAEHDDRR